MEGNFQQSGGCLGYREKMGLIVGNVELEMVKLECKGLGNEVLLVQDNVGEVQTGSEEV